MQVIIQVLAKHGLRGERESDHTGVWVGGAKVAAIGLNASRWVTMHGFSLNVDADLAAFGGIVPCGIHGRPVTRLCDLVSPPGSSLDDLGALRAEVRADVLGAFESVFGLGMEIKRVDAESSELDAEVFPTTCDENLLSRLRAESDRQFELVRNRK